jgi:hypothetical protein
VYSGAHGGDFLTLSDVALLKRELARLASIDYSRAELSEEISPGKVLRHMATPTETAFIIAFFAKLKDLVEASIQVRKPIAF